MHHHLVVREGRKRLSSGVRCCMLSGRLDDGRSRLRPDFAVGFAVGLACWRRRRRLLLLEGLQLGLQRLGLGKRLLGLRLCLRDGLLLWWLGRSGVREQARLSVGNELELGSLQ